MAKKVPSVLSKDSALAPVIRRIGTLTLRPRRLAPYESLVRAVIHQQLSGKAAATIAGRFEERVGDGVFPAPETVAAATDAHLRAVGLSGQKVTYIRGLAQAALEGTLPTLRECGRMDDEAIIETLTGLKGVGRWTVEMFLIFNLGRPDVLPVHDLGVRRGFQLSHGRRSLPEPKALARHGERWAPHRTLATLYLWKAADGAAAPAA
ncbi:MAG: DNA-3-methyladenine glycosylase [Verrucomicrobiota bacterium]|jgi:DNA-3-methyladenine glycosylase II